MVFATCRAAFPHTVSCCVACPVAPFHPEASVEMSPSQETFRWGLLTSHGAQHLCLLQERPAPQAGCLFPSRQRALRAQGLLTSHVGGASLSRGACSKNSEPYNVLPRCKWNLRRDAQHLRVYAQDSCRRRELAPALESK